MSRRFWPFFGLKDYWLGENILYIPAYVENPSSLDVSSFFSFSEQRRIEFCSGNGEWIVEKAKEHPQAQFIAVEKDYGRFSKIVLKREKAGLENLFVVFGDGRVFLNRFVPSHSIEEIYVNFPDPWPKRRHAKHRLIQPLFLEDLYRVLRKEGSFIYVTDDEIHLQQVKDSLLATPFICVPQQEEFVSNYGTSFFRRLWESKGKTIYLLNYRVS